MSYQYETERHKLFTEEGSTMLIKVRDEAFRLCNLAGAVRMDKATEKAGGGDSWTMLACLDYLVERGDLVDVSPPDAWGQHRIFTRPS